MELVRNTPTSAVYLDDIEQRYTPAALNTTIASALSQMKDNVNGEYPHRYMTALNKYTQASRLLVKYAKLYMEKLDRSVTIESTQDTLMVILPKGAGWFMLPYADSLKDGTQMFYVGGLPEGTSITDGTIFFNVGQYGNITARITEQPNGSWVSNRV